MVGILIIVQKIFGSNFSGCECVDEGYRKNPLGPYSVDNCVLSCYFCNNDKSDIFSEKEYIEVLNSSRVKFFRELIKST